MFRTALQIAFWLALAVWYVFLVRPGFPETSAALDRVQDGLGWVVQKGLHLCVYAALAGGALVLFGRRKWWAFGGVAAHAVTSEIGQYVGNEWFQTGRHGCVQDVLIDWSGMAVAYVLWWMRRRIVRRAPSTGARPVDG